MMHQKKSRQIAYKNSKFKLSKLLYGFSLECLRKVLISWQVLVMQSM